MIQRRVLLNGELVYKTRCSGCARRYVRLYLWRKRIKYTHLQMKITDKAYEFTYEDKST